MNELISVEFAPVPQKRKQFYANPLCGATGETFKKYLRKDQEFVPVRFPLVGLGSHQSLLYNKRDPLDEQHFLSESTLVHQKWLHPIKKTPVSLYTPTDWGDPEELFERALYMRTRSRARLLQLAAALPSKYKFSWFWKKEWSRGLDEPSPVFLEARLYGLDTAVTTYDPKRLDGFVLEVIARPWPNKIHREANIKVLRCVSDVLLFSNNVEYISYLDGVDIPRDETKTDTAFKRFKGLLSAKEATELRRHPEKQEEQKNKRKKETMNQYYQVVETK